jgi:hypothetical protein
MQQMNQPTIDILANLSGCGNYLHCLDLLNEDREFFSGMQSKKRLGEIIEIADKELTYEQKALCFLKLIKETEK